MILRELEGNTRDQRQARENASDQVVFGFDLHLIGRANGASFIGQSKRVVK